MKSALCLLLAGLLPSAALLQQEEKKQEEPKEKSKVAMTRFFDEEIERLTKELEGSWMLTDYTDPAVPLDMGRASGFLTFHEGFLTWILSIDTAEGTFFGYRSFLVLESGAYRYRIDEGANLQLASVMSFNNNTVDGAVMRDRARNAFEYTPHLERDVLELRDADGIVLTFRKVEAGEFPLAAERRIEKQRSGTPFWEQNEER